MYYAYFNNRELISTQPQAENIFEARQYANKADVFVINGINYDLHSETSINAIPTDLPFDIHTPAVIELSYIMKIRCQFAEQPVLESLISKTIDVMSTSFMAWRKSDYLQVIRNAYKGEEQSFGCKVENLMRYFHPEIFGSEIDVKDPEEGEHIVLKYYFENKYRRYREYSDVVDMGIDDVPKTLRGFLQIQARNTDRYQTIKYQAETNGNKLLGKGHFHRCNVIDDWVQLHIIYSHSENGTVLGKTTLIKCECDHYKNGQCNGENEFGFGKHLNDLKPIKMFLEKSFSHISNKRSQTYKALFEKCRNGHLLLVEMIER